MTDPTRVRRILVFILLGWLVFHVGNDIVGHWKPSAKVQLGGRVGKDGSHSEEKFATGLLGYSIGIVGAGLALRLQRPILAINLIGTCYLAEAVRHEVFYVWEGGRLFDKDHLTPWIFLMLALGMFWVGYRELREREAALAVLEEVK